MVVTIIIGIDIALIRKYIHAVQRAGVDYIELGYRTKNNSGYFGPLAYTILKILLKN